MDGITSICDIKFFGEAGRYIPIYAEVHSEIRCREWPRPLKKSQQYQYIYIYITYINDADITYHTWHSTNSIYQIIRIEKLPWHTSVKLAQKHFQHQDKEPWCTPTPTPNSLLYWSRLSQVWRRQSDVVCWHQSTTPAASEQWRWLQWCLYQA